MSESHAVRADNGADTTPDPPKLPRSGWVKATPYVMIALYVIGPLVLIPAVGAEHAVVPVIALIFGIAAVAGLVDGLTYRPTFSLPVLAGVGFLFAKALYFNDGTFIYALGCGVVAGLFTLLGGSLRGRAGA